MMRDPGTPSTPYTAGTATGRIPPPETPILHPSPHAVAELGQLRQREMDSISERLGRFSKMPWATIWGAVAAILIGAAVGGALAALQMAPDTDRTAYWAIVGGVLIAGLLAAAAAFSTNSEHTDSIQAIKEDFDKLLAVYPKAEKPAAVSQEVTRPRRSK